MYSRTCFRSSFSDEPFSAFRCPTVTLCCRPSRASSTSAGAHGKSTGQAKKAAVSERDQQTMAESISVSHHQPRPLHATLWQTRYLQTAYAIVHFLVCPLRRTGSDDILIVPIPRHVAAGSFGSALIVQFVVGKRILLVDVGPFLHWTPSSNRFGVRQLTQNGTWKDPSSLVLACARPPYTTDYVGVSRA
jgi:hypothetical protein